MPTSLQTTTAGKISAPLVAEAFPPTCNLVSLHPPWDVATNVAPLHGTRRFLSAAVDAACSVSPVSSSQSPTGSGSWSEEDWDRVHGWRLLLSLWTQTGVHLGLWLMPLGRVDAQQENS